MSFRGADMGQAEMRFIGARNHMEEENPLDVVALNLNRKNKHIEKRDFAGLRDNYQSVKTKFGGVQNLDKVNHLSFEQKESLLYFDEIVRGMSGSLLENKIYYESADEDDYLVYGSSSKDKKHRRKQDRRDRHEKRRRETRKQAKESESKSSRSDRDRDRDSRRGERGTSRSRRGRSSSRGRGEDGDGPERNKELDERLKALDDDEKQRDRSKRHRSSSRARSRKPDEGGKDRDKRGSSRLPPSSASAGMGKVGLEDNLMTSGPGAQGEGKDGEPTAVNSMLFW